MRHISINHDEPRSSEAGLLCDALGVSPEQVKLVSRDPLGEASVAGFDVRNADSSQSLRYYVDTSRLPVQQETGLALGDAASPEARIWLHPADPHLPALQTVAIQGAAASLFTRIGMTSTTLPEFAGYRPGRRAVLRATARTKDAEQTLWVKVVKPSRIQRIVDAHEACARAGVPVPELLAWAPTGLMIIANATGTPAAAVDWDVEQLLDRVDELRTKLTTVRSNARVHGVARRLEWYRARLEQSAGADLSSLLERVSTGARSLLGRTDGRTDGHPDDRPSQVIHGDLHYGQLFLDATGHIVGMIDVDTLGIGDAAEDSAAFVAHAIVSALLTPPELQPRVTALAQAALSRWGDDPRVRGLLAVHLLGHALTATDRADAGFATRLLVIAEYALTERKSSLIIA